nr:MAG TPA: hypothetical protein [Bacteriophage sp.]
MHHQKPLSNQTFLHPIPYPTAIAALIFLALPFPVSLSHKKEDAPRGAPLANSKLFCAVSVPAS